MRASAALEQAERAEADRLAPYEYAKAREYYRKAREEAGESSFENAALYGRLAEDLAGLARDKAREQAAAEPHAAGRQASPGEPARGGPAR
jgi:hypothetical protein